MPDRLIRESICTSETLNELSDFEERFWHRLIVNCDDFGRFDARPAVLKGKLFPLMDGKTKKDMSDALNKLASVGLVELYEVDGKPFLHVVKWSKYQRTRAKRSKYPPPDGVNSTKSAYDNICRQVTADVPEYECDMRYAICECGDEGDTRARDPAVAAVMSAYLDGINETPSPASLEELKGYVDVMGAEVCLRAIYITQDKKAGWAYLRSILRKKQSIGVRSIADWDKSEAEYKKTTKKTGRSMAPDSPDDVKGDIGRMERLLERQRKEMEET